MPPSSSTRRCEKHNEANGEDNLDGHDHNLPDNLGVEGETDDPNIVAARIRRDRAMLATTLLSQGIPMILAGDEFGNTQNGNNNAYCQDNSISWLDWAQARPELQSAVAALSKFRAETQLSKACFAVAETDDLELQPVARWLQKDAR